MSHRPRTIIDKIWDAHVIASRDGQDVIYIDRHYLNEGARFAFEILARDGHPVRSPELTYAFADHWVPTNRNLPIVDKDIVRVLADVNGYTSRAGIKLFGPDDPDHGIAHIVAPEQGLSLPGMTIVCGDSHTTTNGAFGALGFGIGSHEMAHVLATQTLWQAPPKTMRVTFHGQLGPGVTAKDLILSLIAKIGTAGGTGFLLELAGPTIRSLSMPERMTVCNMAVEVGARAGLIAPDETTYAYLDGRSMAPRGAAWARAVEAWRVLPTDEGARFERETEISVADLAPLVTWGTSPETALPITSCVPDPEGVADTMRRDSMRRALGYMGLQAGTPLASIEVDRVFIGSCTNGRIEDLRAVAEVVRGKRVTVPTMVVPGSMSVRRAAEAEGIADVLIAAGMDWRSSGCSMCMAVNGDKLVSGERCASTSNRNFEGRQGKGGRTHLMSPIMAAAAALDGRLSDVRNLIARG